MTKFKEKSIDRHVNHTNQRYKKLLRFGWKQAGVSLEYNGIFLQWISTITNANECRLFTKSDKEGCYKEHWYRDCKCIKDVEEFYNWAYSRVVITLD